MRDAFYEPLGEDRFDSSAATAGPWDPRFQHAGPPSALLARALERCEPRPEMRVARINVDILRPVPVAALSLRTHVARPGRRVDLVEGVVEAGGREIMRGAAWRLATSEAIPVGEPGAPPPLPSAQPEPTWAGAHVDGYMRAIEWRFVTGAFETPGPAQVWARPRLPLVAGEQTSPLCGLLTVADSGSGVGAELDPQEWTFMNTDLTVVVHRHPTGAWVCLESRTTVDADGIGMAETVLSDESGRLGRGLQTLLISAR